MTKSTYDVVIVGGGAAGAVLASRLSEDASRRVALIEAGPDTPPGQEPADILDAYPIVAYFNRSYHWKNLGVHLNDRQDGAAPRRYEQAKVMGGGTSINGQFAVRGLPWDYEDWARSGATGWDWESVLPYFRKLETDRGFPDDPLHGSNGPMPLRRIERSRWSPFTRSVARVLDGQGVLDIEDHNGRTQDGYFPMAINNDADGHRVSTARAYLTPEVRSRPNLDILAGTEMRGLRFEAGRACGVEVRDRESTRTIDAREVVVAAGALQSPAILMRAGIGPAAHLIAMGIEVRADRPGVGQNLQDHPMVALAAYLPKASRLDAVMRRHIQMGYRYSSGLAGTTPGDMFILPSNRAAWHPLGRRLASILVCVNRPYSTGQVRLSDTDPSSGPYIDFRQLSDERDLKRLEDGMRRLFAIVEDPAMQGVVEGVFPATFSNRVRKLGAVSRTNWLLTLLAAGVMETGRLARRLMIENVIVPDVDVESLKRSDNLLRTWIMENACGSWHACGTCRMGDPHDSGTVVDPQGRVVGVEGLRVVDASIMPSIISGNTMLTTIMVGEKIADAMKAESGTGVSRRGAA